MAANDAPVIESLVNRILDLEGDNRFVDITSEDTVNMVKLQTNKNTAKVTESHVRLFREWLATKNELCEISQIEPQNLDLYLAQFFLSVRKPGTSDDLNALDRQYEPSTLLAIHSSIFRHLRNTSYGINIKQDERFVHSRNVLSAKLKELKQLGKGNRPHAAESFSTEEIEALYKINQLGSSNPWAIINTLWLNFTMHFGLRGRQEHVQLMWGDVQLKTSANGEFLEFNERTTKTRQGTTRNNVRPFHPKMFATGKPDCPVRVFKEYEARRPADCKQSDSRFYLQPILKPKSAIWFSKQPIGINSIGTIANKMSKAAGLSKKSNHSARKTAIQTLLHANVSPTDVVQITGHKNVQSLNSYSHLSNDQQKNISSILSKKTSNNDQQKSKSNGCFSTATIATNHDQGTMLASSQTTVAMQTSELDDATVFELMKEWSPDKTLNTSTMSRQFVTPSLSFLNGTVSGNVTININYNK